MGTIRVRLFYWIAKDGDRAFIDASEYVPDPRDLAYGGGRPPGWFLHQEPAQKIPDGAVEFDHTPTADELKAAFPEVTL